MISSQLALPTVPEPRYLRTRRLSFTCFWCLRGPPPHPRSALQASHQGVDDSRPDICDPSLVPLFSSLGLFRSLYHRCPHSKITDHCTARRVESIVTMKLSFASPLLLCLCGTLGLAATTSDDSSKRPHVPCTIKSPVSGAFFDLTSVNVRLPEDGAKTSSEARNTSWPARGYDYGANFTLNICGGVVEKIDQVVGIPESRWRNVSGFYELRGKTYSIGYVLSSTSRLGGLHSDVCCTGNRIWSLYSVVANSYSITHKARLAPTARRLCACLIARSWMTTMMTIITARDQAIMIDHDTTLPQAWKDGNRP